MSLTIPTVWSVPLGQSKQRRRCGYRWRPCKLWYLNLRYQLRRRIPYKNVPQITNSNSAPCKLRDNSFILKLIRNTQFLKNTLLYLKLKFIFLTRFKIFYTFLIFFSEVCIAFHINKERNANRTAIMLQWRKNVIFRLKLPTTQLGPLLLIGLLI